MDKEYIIYADESVDEGEYYSNFYGGVLVRSKDVEIISRSLRDLKIAQNLLAEIKWSKVTSNYLDKYISVMDAFFNYIEEDRLKVRIMFSQNIHVPVGLETYHHEYRYYILYYQFIKHAFGLKYSNTTGQPINLKIYFDKLPDTKEKNALFKAFIVSLGRSQDFRNADIMIKEDQIAEVNSHNHVLLQCLDIVLGAMQFRLNNKHKIIPPGERLRGKRTLAKEKLYKYILQRIRRIYPNFNVGITTGLKGGVEDQWTLPYRHWSFKAKNTVLDFSKAKPKK